MKKRNFFVPDHAVGAEFKEEKLGPDSLDKSESGNSKSAPVSYDWLMNHNVNLPVQVPYIERLIEGGGPIKHKPINDLPDLKTAIMMIPFGEPDSGMTFKVGFVSPDTGLGDTIEFSMIAANYEQLRTGYIKDQIVLEEPGEFFTVKAAKTGRLISYLNTNNPSRVVMANYTLIESFDLFRVGFLIQP